MEKDRPLGVRCRGSGSVNINRASVIGLNGIGRQVALQLAAIGVPRLQLFDNRKVEHTTKNQEGFEYEEIGHFRVHAVAQACHQLNPMLDIETRRKLPKTGKGLGEAAFFCTPHLTMPVIEEPIVDTNMFLARYIPLGQSIDWEFTVGRFSDADLTTSSSSGSSSLGSSVVSVPVASIVAGLMVGEFVHFNTGSVPARKIHFDPRIPSIEAEYA